MLNNCSKLLQRCASSSSLCRISDAMTGLMKNGLSITRMHINNNSTVSIIGAPMSYGQAIKGPESVPQDLRKLGLHTALQELSWTINETGDLEFEKPMLGDPVLDKKYGKAKNVYAVGKASNKIYQHVYEKTSDGDFCLLLGGDHAISIGSLAGILAHRSDTGIIWVDAHADINTPACSKSGNMHGMSVAFAIPGLIDTTVMPGWEWFTELRLSGKTNFNIEKQLVYIGLRDVEEQERAIIRDYNIKAFTMKDIDRHGIGNVMEMTLDYLLGNGNGNRPLHMSYDIDACDPLIAPSTGTMVRGGLTWREAHYVAESVADSSRLCSLDIVEVNPTLANKYGAKITIEMAYRLILSAMGRALL